MFVHELLTELSLTPMHFTKLPGVYSAPMLNQSAVWNRVTGENDVSVISSYSPWYAHTIFSIRNRPQHRLFYAIKQVAIAVASLYDVTISAMESQFGQKAKCIYNIELRTLNQMAIARIQLK